MIGVLHQSRARRLYACIRSWSENITITINTEGRTDIKSPCRGIQAIDYGKDKAKINALFSALEPLLPPQSQPQQ